MEFPSEKSAVPRGDGARSNFFLTSFFCVAVRFCLLPAGALLYVAFPFDTPVTCKHAGDLRQATPARAWKQSAGVRSRCRMK
jgi:hypothetical protein